MKLRKNGFKILLHIVSIDRNPHPDFLMLFKNAIPLRKLPTERIPDLWECIGLDESGVLMRETDHESKMEPPPLFTKPSIAIATTPSTTTLPQPQEMGPVTVLPLGILIARDSNDVSLQIELYKDILEELKSLATAIATDANFGDFSASELVENVNAENASALRNLWNLFRSHYLNDILPQVCTALRICHSSNSDPKSCPKEILQFTLEFMGKSTKMPLELCDNSKLVDQTSAVLHTLLFINEENREISQEFLRQGCLFRMPETVLPIMFNLVYFNESLISTKDTESQELLERQRQRQQSHNIRIRRYINYMKMLLSENPLPLDIEYSMYKDLVCFIRYLIMDTEKSLEEASWYQICRFLLFFQKQLSSPKNPVSSANCGPEVNTLLSETVWICWIRLPFKSPEMWRELEEHMNLVHHSSEVVKTWASIFLQLTSMLHNVVYNVPSSALKDDPTRLKRVRIKTRDVVGSQPLGDTPNKKERDPSAPDVMRPSNGKQKKSEDSDSRHSTLDRTNGSDENINEVSAIQIMKGKSEHFGHIKELKWNSETLLYYWSNFVTAIGKIHLISKPNIHSEVIQALVQAQDQLDRIRMSQAYHATEIPDLFAILGIFFRATFMNLEFEKSIASASGIISRVMCKRHDLPVKNEWHVLYQHFLKRILTSSTDYVKYSVLQNSSKLYSLGLPGITITIPSMMEACTKLSLLADVPPSVVKSMIIILGSLMVYEKVYHREMKTPYIGMEEAEQVIQYRPSSDAKGVGVFEYLKYGVRDTLQNILSLHLKEKNYDFCEMVLWNFSIMLVEEFIENNLYSCLT
jgi:ferredoxin-fold anticodon binding domain-containing protein